MAGDLGLEVVIVGVLSQSRKHLRPDFLIDENAAGIVGPDEYQNVELAEQVGESRLQRVQMGSNSGGA